MSQTLEETMEDLEMQLMQNQLDSLRISIENLANSLGRVPADTIARSCLAILKSMISLSYCGMIVYINRSHEVVIQHKLEEIQKFQALTCSFADDGKDDRRGSHDRKENLLHLASSIMPATWYFHSYNPSDLFLKQAENIRAICLDELRNHYGNSLMVSSDDDEMSSDVDAPFKRWMEKEDAKFEKHFRLPVIDDVVSVTLRTYKDCRDLKSPSPEGMAIHALCPLGNGEEWSVREVEISSEPSSYPRGTTIEAITMTRNQLAEHYGVRVEYKKEVPATHPSLRNLDLDFDKEIPEEYGIVIAWRFVGSEAWRDRYGHIIPQDPFL
ncbi:hypothetical protein FANTH_13306 [Fusarium anthophilum]|uniref:Uncharacterized protein n=1 Tax=Fusarium anthophilum TaxID=48485 RepID=A0A8H4YP12_9HYPO|nr:hypothetical protein FANTH_13306 [Fusarium anthophilum]